MGTEVQTLLEARDRAGDFLEGPQPAPGAETGIFAKTGRRFAPGDRLGRYQIEHLVGAGGMGEVYRARDTRLDRTVVLKVLPARTAADPEWRARLEREARAVSRLNHPHVCALYHIGQEEGTDSLVMEYFEGRRWPSVSDGGVADCGRHVVRAADCRRVRRGA